MPSPTRGDLLGCLRLDCKILPVDILIRMQRFCHIRARAPRRKGLMSLIGRRADPGPRFSCSSAARPWLLTQSTQRERSFEPALPRCGGALRPRPSESAVQTACPVGIMEVEQEPAATGAPPTAQTVPPDDCFIRFRLSAIDFVPSSERSHFDNRRSPFSRDELHTVPVIRIFGATDRGQRVCAHVHGAFPYVYVEYKGKLDPTSGQSRRLSLRRTGPRS